MKAKVMAEIPSFVDFLVQKEIVFDLDYDYKPRERGQLMYRTFGVVWGMAEETNAVYFIVRHPIKRYRGDGRGSTFVITDEFMPKGEQTFEFDDLEEALVDLFNRIGKGYGNQRKWVDPQRVLDDLLIEFYELW